EINDEPQSKKKYKRYTVVYVQLKAYIVNDTQLMEKLLLVDQNHEKRPAKVYLRQDWIHSQISEGDIINICFTSGTDQTTYSWIIDNDHNFLVHYPDRLISCTAVAESFFCLRKSVLQMTTKGVSDFSEPLVHGAIIHETLQYCLKHKNFTTATIQDALKRTINSTMDSLYVIGQDEMTAYGLLEPYVKSIQSFGSVYVGDHPKRAATVKRDMGPTTKENECSTVAIREILDIEEHIWSAAYGLKGMIDATVEMVLSPSKKILTLPFELKTGKVSRNISHRAQTILYTLLMGDRYDIDISTGVLYYSKTNSFYMVPASRSELRSLIMARNDLAAAYQRQATVLPPMIKNFHSCQYCAMNDACVIYHKIMEGGSAATSGLGQWFDDHTGHIDGDAISFYRHWIGLIAMEEKDLDHLRKDIWNESPQKREMIGKCLKNMVVASTQNDDSASNWYTFRRHTNDPDGLSLLNSSIMVGDTIVVSSMQGDLLLGTGFVMQIDPQSVTISLNTPLRHVPVKENDFDLGNHQVFKKWWTMQHNRDSTTYRLDKDEAAGGFALMKSNLVALMTNNPSKKSSSSSSADQEDIHTKLRQLIVESKPPRFARLDEIPFSSSVSDKYLNHLNKDQLTAVQKVMTCKDYALILGMPGTGKTMTTAELIKVLVGQGKSVLLTAYTHNALDNILLKLVEQGVDILRLGNPEKFILVGDQYQLPPIVKDKKASAAGFSTSLFTMLARNHPDAIAFLEYQYRMNKDIMTISSELIYDSKLKCGNDDVANKTLYIPRFDQGLKSIHSGTNDGDKNCHLNDGCWLKDIMDPK
ncbi:DNA replication factor Dna2-domain-containing protein, partial [Absidia repens]